MRERQKDIKTIVIYEPISSCGAQPFSIQNAPLTKDKKIKRQNEKKTKR